MTDRDTALRALSAGVAVLAVVGGYIATRSPGSRAAFVPLGSDAAVEATGPCASGLAPIAGGACFAAARAVAPRPLVVYLHGLHQEATLGDELDRQARVARAATERGFDVVALRGRLGVCERLPEMYCWPSNERTADRGPAAVAAWEPALVEASRRGGSGPRHLLGFSNGGYFAALVATRALAPFESIAIAHGGPVEPVRARGSKPPMLLLAADDDAALPEMMRLDGALAREKWPHVIVARDGGHALTDQDIANALAFFTRAPKEGVDAAARRLVGHPAREAREVPATAGPLDASAASPPRAPDASASTRVLADAPLDAGP